MFLEPLPFWSDSSSFFHDAYADIMASFAETRPPGDSGRIAHALSLKLNCCVAFGVACKSWCGAFATSWKHKCTWEQICDGCPQCSGEFVVEADDDNSDHKCSVKGLCLSQHPRRLHHCCCSV